MRGSGPAEAERLAVMLIPGSCFMRFPSFRHCGAFTLLLCITLASPHHLEANPDGKRFFIDTNVEWLTLRGNSPRRFETSRVPIYGATTVVVLCDGGTVALLSGYFRHEPQKQAFVFEPSEGYSVQIGRWEKAAGNQFRVEYGFAFGHMLACPVGSQSYEDCYGFRYREPATTATWSVTANHRGEFTRIDAPSTGEVGSRRYTLLLRLRNRREVLQILKDAESALAKHRNVR